MAITPLSGSTSGDEVWGDFSGGEIVFGIISATYTAFAQFRVLPFDTSGTGLFTGPPAGSTNGLQQEADNLCTLIAALYDAGTTVTASHANQALTDHSGEMPYDYSFAGTSSHAGTAGGTANPVPTVLNFNGRGGDGSRWRVTLPGYSNAIGGGVAKDLYGALTGAPAALAAYLTRQANGPTHAVKSCVCTHNGVTISTAGFSVTSMINKRLRRHFKLV
jgi:hypothetical protein